MPEANADLLLNGAGDPLKDVGKTEIFNAFLVSVFTDKTGLQESLVHLCLTSVLVQLFTMEHWMHQIVVLLFRQTLRETG